MNNIRVFPKIDNSASVATIVLHDIVRFGDQSANAVKQVSVDLVFMTKNLLNAW